MKLRKTLIKRLALMSMLCAALGLTSCDKDDNGDTPPPVVPETGLFFLSLAGESSEYVMVADEVESGTKHINDNFKELELSSYTWLFNSDPSVAVGLIYSQGDPGLGLGFYVNSDYEIAQSPRFDIASRFTSYGFFKNYIVTTVNGQTPVDSNGNALLEEDGVTERTDGATVNFYDVTNNFYHALEKTPTTKNIAGNGEQATFSGIVGLDNGTFLTGLVLSQPRAAGSSGGSSIGSVTYPDSCWVAAFDSDLNVKRIYRSNKISYASGRYNSRNYPMIDIADNGDVYVFSGSYDSNTTLDCGAIRIPKSTNYADFDDYYFNIEEQTGGLRFRQVWYITGNYFLLQFYNETPFSNATGATRYAVADMANKTVKFIESGFPSYDVIEATGTPMAYNGKMYLPITVDAQDPAIYVINPATATAAKGLVIEGATSIKAVGRLKSN